jgi:flagellar hook-basal body complex protein FliE
MKRPAFDPLFPVRRGRRFTSIKACTFVKEAAMDLRINALPSQAVTGVGQTAIKRPATGAVGGVGGGFADNFKSALDSVSKAQNDASRLQNEVQKGNPNVSLEETMLAMQKAQIGFQATLHVRNRMVQAYTDIMNMSV